MQFFKKYQKALITAVLGVALFLLGGSLVPNFLKAGNLLNVVRQSSVIAIAAVGMSQVIVIKGIDLSVGGNISFCGMVVGILFANGVSVPVAIIAAIATGLLLGLIFAGGVPECARVRFHAGHRPDHAGRGLSL